MMFGSAEETAVAEGCLMFVPNRASATMNIHADAQRPYEPGPPYGTYGPPNQSRGGTIRMPVYPPPRAFQRQAPQVILPRNVPRAGGTSNTSQTSEVVSKQESHDDANPPDLMTLLAAATKERNGWADMVEKLTSAIAVQQQQQQQPKPTMSEAARKRAKAKAQPTAKNTSKQDIKPKVNKAKLSVTKGKSRQ